MNDKNRPIKLKWIDKLKNIKHIEIYITIIFIIILLLILFSSSSSKQKTTTSKSSSNKVEQTTITTYIDEMENKLEHILSQVEGASNVNVMLTLNMDDAIIKDNIIQTQGFPNVKGVIIVANGVENTMVRMNILKAVQAVIDISSGRIEILSSN